MENDQPSLHVLAEQVIEAARTRNQRLVTVESCSAGALATLLSNIPGAGESLEGGCVSYAKSFKSDVLGIDVASIYAVTAVSESVAFGMAEGALSLSPSADIAVAITGVCGPEPDEDGNPVGLAYVAVMDRNGRLRRKKLEIASEPGGKVRGALLLASLELLVEFLKEER